MGQTQVPRLSVHPTAKAKLHEMSVWLLVAVPSNAKASVPIPAQGTHKRHAREALYCSPGNVVAGRNTIISKHVQTFY